MDSFKCVGWNGIQGPITEHYCDFLHSRHGASKKSLTVVHKGDQPYYWRSELFHNEFPIFHPVFYRQLNAR